MPPHYRAHIDAARTERKIALGKLAADREKLATTFEQATGEQATSDATDWELICGILQVEFPPAPRYNRRLGRSTYVPNPEGRNQFSKPRTA